ncbi:MAG: cytidine deaminase [Gammaproteobacteria bacterium]|jgi:cytidine deaminase|nr:cytidine deaminase [Gammaproteobacteria bacterium]
MSESIESELLEQLKRLRENAYAPYSRHPVAVVVETASGRRFGGANVEVAHFKSLCAEASALSAMIAAGERHVRRVYVLGPGQRPCPPCGDCRQRVREFADDAAEFVAVDDRGRITLRRSLGELLPDSFGPDHVDG